MVKSKLRNVGLDYEEDEDKESELKLNDQGEYISKIRPTDIEYTEKPIVDPKKYWISKEEARKAFNEKGFSLDAINAEVQGTNGKQFHILRSAENFFRKVDISKEPITQEITTMCRLKALEHYKDNKGREKTRVKEFITYNLDLHGVDWLGNPVNGKLEFEGRCEEPVTRISIKSDEYGRQSSEFTWDGNNIRYKYYIPFSKKAVEDLLKKTETDKDTVRYIGKFASDVNGTNIVMRTGGYKYDQFVNTEWPDFYELARREGGPTGVSMWKEVPHKQYIG